MTPTAEHNQRIAQLVEKYLEKALETITAQLDGFSDRAWLREQTASEAGVLHGILFDKVIRILEAVERVERKRDGDDNVVEFDSRKAGTP